MSWPPIKEFRFLGAERFELILHYIAPFQKNTLRREGLHVKAQNTAGKWPAIYDEWFVVT